MCVCIPLFTFTFTQTHTAAPSEHDPAASPPPAPRHPERLPGPRTPHLLEGGQRNEGARGRRVAAGGAAGAPNELETREAKAGVRYGRGEAED
jgi:hypothetical protein